MSRSLSHWQASGSRFEFRGHDVFCQIETNAQSDHAWLLIHGFPTASWDWHKIWAPLATDSSLIAPDLLGLGYSAKPKGHRYTVAEQADLCVAALAHAGVSRVSVLAHDYGDTVAQELLARCNEGELSIQLNRMVFLNGGLFPETHRPRLIQRVLASSIGPLLARWVSYRRFAQTMRAIAGQQKPSDAELKAFWTLLTHNDGKQAMPSLLNYLRERVEYRGRWVGALQAASVPIALINGVEDPISGAHMVVRFRELVPHAKVVELYGVGHYPQIEAPAVVLRALREIA